MVYCAMKIISCFSIAGFEGWCHVYKLRLNIKVSCLFNVSLDFFPHILTCNYVSPGLKDGLRGRPYFTFPLLQVLQGSTLLV